MSQPDRPTFSINRIGPLLARLRRPWEWLQRRPGAINDGTAREDPDRARVRVQAGVIRRAFDGEVGAAASADGDERSEDDADAAYFFRPGQALVREDRFGEVIEFFDRRRDDFAGELERSEQPLPGLVSVRFPQRRDDGDDVLRTLRELDVEVPPDRDGRPAASPDHILYVTTRGNLCPATEPEHPPTDVPVPQFMADPAAGRGVRVSVVDTGWWAQARMITPWLADGVDADPQDEEVVNQAAIHEYAGHGTFVTGVIKCAAPSAHVQVQGALTHGGAVYESAIVAQLHEAYTEQDDPQLISISAGTHSRRDFALIGFDALADALGWQGSETLVIAAAGNDGDTRPFWPAAFDWAVGVGSVDPDRKVSTWSNTGPWVDVFARGRDHVNAFPIGTYTCSEPANLGQVRQFDGLAQWSGTSFATPVVTGLVAAEMSRSGSDARTAYAAVFNVGIQRHDVRAGDITIVGPLT